MKMIFRLLVTFLIIASTLNLAQEVKFEKNVIHLSEIDWGKTITADNGVQTFYLLGNPKEAGYYIILVRIPPNVKLVPHFHPENRTVVVTAGKFYWNYGNVFDESKLLEMHVGAYFVEPADEPHFAQTKNDEVILQVNGFGPTGTTLINK